MEALILSLQLAAVTTVILLLGGLPLAWWLRSCPGWLRVPLEALIALPVVLPPSVLGFYLLIALAPDGPVGRLSGLWGGEGLAFTFTGLVLGSVVYSLPFVVQPLLAGFSQTGPAPLQNAAALGAGPVDRFLRVVLPGNRRAIITAGVLGFAHTLGEFGVVLMIGGNIPGRTRVVSIAIYDHVEALEYGEAHQLSLILLGLSFAVLLLVAMLNRTTVTAGRGL